MYINEVPEEREQDFSAMVILYRESPLESWVVKNTDKKMCFLQTNVKYVIIS